MNITFVVNIHAYIKHHAVDLIKKACNYCLSDARISAFRQNRNKSELKDTQEVAAITAVWEQGYRRSFQAVTSTFRLIYAARKNCEDDPIRVLINSVMTMRSRQDKRRGVGVVVDASLQDNAPAKILVAGVETRRVGVCV
ncbi:hypothetical protein TcasGA2_TC014766 [Tribolium castaneum]|uniref:Uncharacterized protein n=1 Tax=Tribolium castaneum TaxID=7070 RepID=D6WJM2_TRICA|nr:hypothetical protein TcasGA2_TC014766 [Tribolium castaneum]